MSQPLQLLHQFPPQVTRTRTVIVGKIDYESYINLINETTDDDDDDLDSAVIASIEDQT